MTSATPARSAFNARNIPLVNAVSRRSCTPSGWRAGMLRAEEAELASMTVPIRRAQHAALQQVGGNSARNCVLFLVLLSVQYLFLVHLQNFEYSYFRIKIFLCCCRMYPV